MKSLNEETLRELRNQLQSCITLMHDETNANAKQELRKVIAVIDDTLKTDRPHMSAVKALKLLDKVLSRVPSIVALLEFLE